MKKIININLSGRVIPIEDAAYEKLQAYIESLRRYFAGEEGRDEIINDIESRIAELMNEKVRKGATCVTDADVEEIIASIGRPQDFDAADNNESTKATEDSGPNFTRPRAKSRLYRDSSDKFISGVCSGIAAYLNVDPAIVRILFAIITFGGFGLGFLIYILLWIVLPTRDLEGYRGKRLFRNPEDKVLGGVASGLAAYLNRDVKNIRLIILAPLIASIILGIIKGVAHFEFDVFPNLVFGSLNGTIFLIYVVLWIVLPEAHSPYEKMEMRGEKVDLNSIRQNVKDSRDNVKDRFKEWGAEVKESADNLGKKASEFANTRGKAFASEVGESARRGGQGLGHVIGVLFKAFFLIIAGTIAFSLLVALMALIFGGFAWSDVNNFLWTSKWQQLYAWGTIVFFLLVPVVAFLTWIIRRMLKVRSRSSYLGWTFGCLWTLGWISLVLLIATISRDFSTKRTVESDVAITQPPAGKMIVAVGEKRLEYTGSYSWIDGDISGWDIDDDSLRVSAIHLDVDKSPDSLYHVTLISHSWGRNNRDAEQRAEKIVYHVTSMDSVLDLANGFAVGKESKYRGQYIGVLISVPRGKKIRFDYSVTDKLEYVRVDWNRSRRFGRNNQRWDVTTDFPWTSNIDYVMGEDGELRDAAGRAPRFSDRRIEGGGYEEYRYQPDVRDQLEEEKRRRDESERRIKELEEAERAQPAPDTTAESMDDDEDEVAGSPASSAFSVMSWL